jgi:FKBP-type peptidyl-prolyl cis-trans isomerase 2
MRSAGSIPILPVTLIVATALIAVSLGGYLAFFQKDHEPADEENLIVATGDVVSVDYVGMFQNGKVFDTSIESVAYNDVLYPKSVSYERRSSYSPLNFTVGGGQMVTGFDSGVVGMYVGETKDIVVLPADGYGSPNLQQIKTRQIVEAVPVYQFGVPLTNFTDRYEVAASVGVNVVDSYWGWNVTVYSIDLAASTVTLKHMPDIGMTVKPYGGWSCRIDSIDESADGGAGRIMLRNLLTADDANAVKGVDSEGQEFRVTSVDIGDGTFVADYNKEVVGQVLVFRVTMLSATKQSSS